MWPLTHFPQFEEVSELWVLLIFLCEGFAHQSDLLPERIRRSTVIIFVVLHFKPKKAHQSHLVKSFQTTHWSELVQLDSSVHLPWLWLKWSRAEKQNRVPGRYFTRMKINFQRMFSISQEAQLTSYLLSLIYCRGTFPHGFSPEGRSVTLIVNALQQTISILLCPKK